MKTIKKIDLLKKIANGEELPALKGEIEKDFSYYIYNEIGETCGLIDLKNVLNDEVEIIEEEKEDNFTGWKMYQDGKEVCSMDCSVEEDNKIEYVGKEYDLTTFYFAHKEAATMLKDMGNKMKELIDEVNKLKHDTK